MVTGRAKSEADNAKNFSSNYIAAGDLETQWNKRYTVIGIANRVIRNVDNIQASTAVKQIPGEALFMSSRMYLNWHTVMVMKKQEFLLSIVQKNRSKPDSAGS